MYMPKFYRQESGLISIPFGYTKWQVTWTLDNVLEGFKHFFSEHGRYPMAHELVNCAYLPTPKTLDRKFGGITKIRGLLGLNDVDYRKGALRSAVSARIGKRGFDLEEEMYQMLASRFHEPFVHYQSRIALSAYGSSTRVDFLVYHRDGKFAIDVFYPDNERSRFSNNVAMKIKIYKNFPFRVYLVVGNPEIGSEMIVENQTNAVNYRNANIVMLTKEEFSKTVGEYQPLPDPYISLSS